MWANVAKAQKEAEARSARQVILASLGVAAFVCVLIPSWREVASLALRTELIQHGPDLTVHGYEPGCVIYSLPFVELSERAKSRIVGSATSSRENWLVARAFSSAPGPVPKHWLDDPLLPWIAIGHAGDPQLLAAAQHREPTNGALWAAAACAHRSDPVASEALLDEAVRRQPWKTYVGEAQERVFVAAEQAGLPRIGALYWSGMPTKGRAHLEYCLEGIFTEVLRKADGDLPRTRRIIDRFAQLKSVTWAENGGPFLNNLGRTALSAYRLLGSQWNPPEAVIRRALDHRASPAAVAVLASHVDYTKNRWNQRWWDAYNEMEGTFGAALIFSSILLSILAFAVPMTMGHRLNSPLLRGVVWAAAFALSVQLIARALQAFGIWVEFVPKPGFVHPRIAFQIPWIPILVSAAAMGLCLRAGRRRVGILAAMFTGAALEVIIFAAVAAESLVKLTFELGYSF